MIFPTERDPETGEELPAIRLPEKVRHVLQVTPAEGRDPGQLWIPPLPKKQSDAGERSMSVSVTLPYEEWIILQEALSSRLFPWRTMRDLTRAALWIFSRDVLGPRLEARWAGYLKRREATRQAAWLEVQTAEWGAWLTPINKAVKLARDAGFASRAADLARRVVEDLDELRGTDPELAGVVTAGLAQHPELAEEIKKLDGKQEG